MIISRLGESDLRGGSIRLRPASTKPKQGAESFAASWLGSFHTGVTVTRSLGLLGYFRNLVEVSRIPAEKILNANRIAEKLNSCKA